MALVLFTQAQFEARVGTHVVRQVFDDDNDGVVDTAAIDQLAADATSFVLGFVRGIIPIDQIDANAVPGELTRFALDYAQATMAMRHPEYVRADGGAMMKTVRQELSDLRDGKTRLDISSPPLDPPKNARGYVLDGTADSPDPPARVFDDMGDFFPSGRCNR